MQPTSRSLKKPAPRSRRVSTSAIAWTTVTVLAAGVFVSEAVPSAPAAAPICIGIVTVTQVEAEKQTSARVVTDPQDFVEVAGLRVFNIDAPQLQGQVEDGKLPEEVLKRIDIEIDGKKQPADQPVVWTPSSSSSTSALKVTLRDDPRLGTPDRPNPATDAPGVLLAAGTIAVAPKADQFAPAQTNYTTSPTITPGGVAAIRGDFGGDIRDMAITVDNLLSAKLIAAKPGILFWQVPAGVAPGARRISFRPGKGRRAVAFTVYALGIQARIDQPLLLQGHWTSVDVTLAGLDEMPASMWEPGLPSSDLVDLTRWEASAGGADVSQPLAASVEVVFENQSAQTIRMGDGSVREVARLHRGDFPKVIRKKLYAMRTGTFRVHVSAAAFLKQISIAPEL